MLVWEARWVGWFGVCDFGGGLVWVVGEEGEMVERDGGDGR
jgi:hypothetical protein